MIEDPSSGRSGTADGNDARPDPRDATAHAADLSIWLSSLLIGLAGLGGGWSAVLIVRSTPS